MRRCAILLAAAWFGLSSCTSSTTTTTTTAPATVPSSTTAPPATSAGSTSAATTTTVPVTTAPTVPATTVPVTTAPVTTVPPTSSPPTTAAPCPVTGTVADTNDGFPQRMSALVGVAIRTGARPCYERVVIELGTYAGAVASDFPGYQLHYTTPPVMLSPLGEPADVRTPVVLVVSMGMWMGDMEGHGYAGPRDITPTNVTHVRQLLQIENYEGQTAWAVGLDAVYPYTVFTLDGPPRLVIDLLVS